MYVNCPLVSSPRGFLYVKIDVEVIYFGKLFEKINKLWVLTE